MGENMTTLETQTSAAGNTLFVRNGQAAAMASVPVLSFGMFAHSLQTALRDGARLSALFALAGRPETKDEAPCRLVAVLALDAAGLVQILAADVENAYPSLTPRIPQAHLFEREIHERCGIVPEGHPWLKPVRFSRLAGPDVGHADFYRIDGDEVHEVAVGPIHAGIIECGHFRFQCLGELVMHLEISLGYHHRGLEAHLVGGPDKRSLPLLETLSGDAGIAHAWAWCSVIEALSGREASPRGQLLRSLALELERLANHTGDMGALSGDIGFLPTHAYCGRLRGDWLNMTAMLCGNRFGRSFLRLGGVTFDPDRALSDQLKKRLHATARDVRGALRALWDSPSVMARFTGIGKISAEDAAALGLVGPAARACGLERDARSSHPLDGLPAPPELVSAPWGDVLARARVREREIQTSIAYCHRLLEDFIGTDREDGADDHPQALSAPGQMADPAPVLTPDSIAVSLVEAWRGEVCHVAVTGTNGRLRAVSLVDPSFHNWAGLAMALRNGQISDFPLCNKSFNLSYCGHDQ
ncbi:MAG: NADH-quinone oxidoreductase subunit C [Desulfovibrio sp.]|jgi:Ni,Fe-hydrogenase III large subunit/Ni,Fe-hydrogenase III component G|nr:NADH-quinone oxidoreductase subunit C [Desulfovibrio sp.]